VIGMRGEVGSTPLGTIVGRRPGRQAVPRHLGADVEGAGEPFEDLGALLSIQGPFQAFMPTRAEDPGKDAPFRSLA
jgi:hypothetical protein